MISPSHQLALYPKEQVTSGGMSRMPNYTDRMSVRQIVDLVAFLPVALHRAPYAAYLQLSLTDIAGSELSFVPKHRKRTLL